MKSLVVVLGVLFASSAMAQDKLASQKALFDKYCKKCHAEDGSGKKPTGEWLPVVKTLKLEKPEMLSIISDEAKKKTDDDIKKMILEGKDKMKATKATPEEAIELVAYVRHLQGGTK
ncbi:MAG TPA: c-type cytochrome [Bdellovibrionota bacterium]|nr:c-type cytochrome [Bdellovibrionota bacterium]